MDKAAERRVPKAEAARALNRIRMREPARQKRAVKLRDVAATILPHESGRPKRHGIHTQRFWRLPKEKEIIQIKVTENITFSEDRKKVSLFSGRTYADAARRVAGRHLVTVGTQYSFADACTSLPPTKQPQAAPISHVPEVELHQTPRTTQTTETPASSDKPSLASGGPPEAMEVTPGSSASKMLTESSQAAVSRIQGVEDPENYPSSGAWTMFPLSQSMDVTTCEDIPFLARRVVREELVRLQAGGVPHQCSFAACPEPPPYWMRERHVENRPRTETADFTPRLPFSLTGPGHHWMSSTRRAAAGIRQSPTRPVSEDYYASTQNVPAERDPSPRTSATSAPANVSRQVPVYYTCGLPGHVSRFCPRRTPAPPRFLTYPARMYETPVPPRFSTHPPRMHVTWTSQPADHRPRQQWLNEFRSESPASERSLTPPPTRSRRPPSPRRRSPSPHRLGN
ncbi:hypothetical protein HPB51_020704 [Rhipicephalus microplus]|uniref:CCHC-type domain-containing protein n=1 Tax=Rhipicephalus microplus TaxID=6941 RepID=A0A9J6EBQ3_RHIMP|nr:hypothetical protein HPB51_020704 [Rhipicephalus microplus]